MVQNSIWRPNKYLHLFYLHGTCKCGTVGSTRSRNCHHYSVQAIMSPRQRAVTQHSTRMESWSFIRPWWHLWVEACWRPAAGYGCCEAPLERWTRVSWCQKSSPGVHPCAGTLGIAGSWCASAGPRRLTKRWPPWHCCLGKLPHM